LILGGVIFALEAKGLLEQFATTTLSMGPGVDLIAG